MKSVFFVALLLSATSSFAVGAAKGKTNDFGNAQVIQKLEDLREKTIEGNEILLRQSDQIIKRNQQLINQREQIIEIQNKTEKALRVTALLNSVILVFKNPKTFVLDPVVTDDQAATLSLMRVSLFPDPKVAGRRLTDYSVEDSDRFKIVHLTYQFEDAGPPCSIRVWVAKETGVDGRTGSQADSAICAL